MAAPETQSLPAPPYRSVPAGPADSRTLSCDRTHQQYRLTLLAENSGGEFNSVREETMRTLITGPRRLCKSKIPTQKLIQFIVPTT